MCRFILNIAYYYVNIHNFIDKLFFVQFVYLQFIFKIIKNMIRSINLEYPPVRKSVLVSLPFFLTISENECMEITTSHEYMYVYCHIKAH